MLLPQLSQKYRANKYNALTMNCNHFTNELLQIVTAGRVELPNYINRMARVGSIFHFMVPKRYLNNQSQESAERRRLELADPISNITQSEASSRFALLSSENEMWPRANDNRRASGSLRSDSVNGLNIENLSDSQTESQT